MEKERINRENLRIEKLDDRHIEILKSFQSSNSELKDFLVEDALEQQKANINVTYLFFYNPEDKLVAYITLCSDAIIVSGTKLRKNFTDKGVLYKTLPGLKICRLSVDERFERKGIGAITIFFSMQRLLQVDEKVACRFIIVEAKRESINFYKRMGFEVLKEKEKGPLPMYFDMIKQIRIFKQKKDELSKIKEKEK